jgi:hypothetical protein
VDARPGFADMLRLIAGNGVRAIIVESADRFARDLMVQEAGHAFLQRLGITLVSAAAPDSFLSDTPSAVLMRQMFGAMSQFDRAMTVAKLKAARDRKRATGVKVEGRRSYAETVQRRSRWRNAWLSSHAPMAVVDRCMISPSLSPSRDTSRARGSPIRLRQSPASSIRRMASAEGRVRPLSRGVGACLERRGTSRFCGSGLVL